MSDAAQLTFVERLPDRERRQRIADALAVAVGVSLPWSISATDVFIVLWLIVCLTSIDPAALRRTIMLPAAALPAVLCLLALLGTTWSDVGFAQRFGDFKVFPRLFVIALLMVQFQRSERGTWVIGGFLVSCLAVLALSWAQWVVPALTWRGIPGVPVKDYIIQNGEFLLCAFALSHLSLGLWQCGRYRSATVLALLAFLFLANIAFVATARSALVIFAALVIVFGFQRFGARGALVITLVAVAFSSAIWMSSAGLRARVQNVVHEVQDYRTKQSETSAGYRLEFWRKSVAIVANAPIFGHGTGSLRDQFARLAADTSIVSAAVTDNPHNQTLVVAIQLGLVGVVLLYAMWMAHALLFRGNEWMAWVGMGVVVHAIGAGLFSSALFEATLGWIYIFGIGVLGGMVLRERQARARSDACEADTASS